MAQINVSVGGHTYALACRDGEEERLKSLAGHINAKTETLRGALGQVSEPRMLLMAALLVTDELFELRDRTVKDQISAPATAEAATSALTTAAARIDALAASFEKAS
jgi:cell division protein ZapA